MTMRRISFAKVLSACITTFAACVAASSLAAEDKVRNVLEDYVSKGRIAGVV